MSISDRVVSVWDMFELNGVAFYEAVTEIRRIRTIIEGQLGADHANREVDSVDRRSITTSLNALIQALNAIGARLALLSTQKLAGRLSDPSDQITYGETSDEIGLIEGRLRDELSFVQLFVIPPEQARLFGGADYLLGQPTADRFRSAWFDCEEAAKCLCLGRPTATVFHCMKMLEVAIRALAKRLDIPDPVKPAQKNWGMMLNQIKEALDQKHPVSSRKKGSEGQLIERIYSSLDAVKNPWRNATMHVENVYTENEANHILQCVAVLLQQMAEGFDQDGGDVQPLLPDSGEGADA